MRRRGASWDGGSLFFRLATTAILMYSMAVSYEVVYYEAETGKCPVEEFIEGFDELKEQPLIFARLSILEDLGTGLPRPYAAYLRDKIHELRFRVRGNHYRILYFFTAGNRIVLTHGFAKKSGKVPDKEIERAIRCRKDYLDRMGEV